MEIKGTEISDRYNPNEVEGRIYRWWEEQGHFKAKDTSTKPPFCVILPPPNVTGILHMGHALDHTIQDVVVRWKRMSGFNTLWLPGADHAGIATQSVVEKELKKSQTSRHELGREAFLAKVWEWKNKYGDRICKQMRYLGDSCDWDRLVFTLDPGVSKAVRKVFVSLYSKGWIYRGKKLVNWSGPLETAISDLEVEHKQVKGSLWHIDYRVEGSSEILTIATTRPETLLGDTAVAVHPEDTRYKHLIGQNVELPLLGRKIPIIADEYVDKTFGSGVVKITPAHDFNDYKIAKTHKLPMINILNTRCELNENAGPYKGLSVIAARKKVLEDLQRDGLLRKEEPHLLNVGHCSRSGAVVEPFLSEQWFVKTEHLAQPAKRAVETGTIRFEPESWAKTYLHWMNIIEDWCISRQLWWGHRIPAWYCQGCGHTSVSEEDLKQCQKCQSTNIKQEEDVLDTWFSSALWPFSTLGWPNQTEALKTFYPTNLMVTGHDIIFFWVARMIMMGLEFAKDVPFRTVYIHGLVRDAQGQKISKSLQNALDPVELIEKFGADSMRFTLMAQIASGRDLKFSEQRLEGYRNFMNKIWNATRYALTALSDFAVPGSNQSAFPALGDLSIYDQWLIAKLAKVEGSVGSHLEEHRFSMATQDLYSFVWHDFCDWYLEFIKPIINGEKNKQRQATQHVLALVLNRMLRLLHPFIPFITEELYQKIPIRGSALIVDVYPTPAKDRELLALGKSEAAAEVELIREVVSAIRNIRGENRIKPGEKVLAKILISSQISNHPTNQNIHEQITNRLQKNQNAISVLARLSQFEIVTSGSLSKCGVTPLIIEGCELQVVVPLEGLVDIGEEIKRIQKNLEKLEKEAQGLSGRLNNVNFVTNAPEEVVEQDRETLKNLRSQMESTRSALARLQS